MTSRVDVTFNVLFVCTANVCRSPLAERLMRGRLMDGMGIKVSSVGVRALVGEPMNDAAGQVLTQLGGTPNGHVARQISRSQIQSADLVLTAATKQRAATVRAIPLAWRRTFTMREFARLGESLPPPRPAPAGNKLARRVLDVADMRGVLGAPSPGQDDIADPYGAKFAVMERCGQQISQTVDEILGVLGAVVLV